MKELLNDGLKEATMQSEKVTFDKLEHQYQRFIAGRDQIQDVLSAISFYKDRFNQGGR